jgi:hypothetical protein
MPILRVDCKDGSKCISIGYSSKTLSKGMYRPFSKTEIIEVPEMSKESNIIEQV